MLKKHKTGKQKTTNHNTPANILSSTISSQKASYDSQSRQSSLKHSKTNVPLHIRCTRKPLITPHHADLHITIISPNILEQDFPITPVSITPTITFPVTDSASSLNESIRSIPIHRHFTHLKHHNSPIHRLLGHHRLRQTLFPTVPRPPPSRTPFCAETVTLPLQSRCHPVPHKSRFFRTSPRIREPYQSLKPTPLTNDPSTDPSTKLSFSNFSSLVNLESIKLIATGDPPRQEISFIQSLRRTLKYVWVKGETLPKVQVIVAIFLLFLGKASNVTMPLIFRDGIDHIAQENPIAKSFTTHMSDTPTPIATTNIPAPLQQHLITEQFSQWIRHFLSDLSFVNEEEWTSLPTALLLTYGVMRVFSVLMSESKNIIFSSVVAKSVHQISTSLITRLLTLGHHFNSQRDTPSLCKAIDRGIHALRQLLSTLAFDFIPVIIEMLLTVVMLASVLGYDHAFIATITISVYWLYTMRIVKWRGRFRRQFNKADNLITRLEDDFLINWKSAQELNNVYFLQHLYSQAVTRFTRSYLQIVNSGAVLKLGQVTIFTLGMSVAMIYALYSLKSHSLTLGEFVVLHQFYINLITHVKNLSNSYATLKGSVLDLQPTHALEQYHSALDQPKNPILIKVRQPTTKTFLPQYSPPPQQSMYHIRKSDREYMVDYSQVPAFFRPIPTKFDSFTGLPVIEKIADSITNQQYDQASKLLLTTNRVYHDAHYLRLPYYHTCEEPYPNLASAPTLSSNFVLAKDEKEICALQNTVNYGFENDEQALNNYSYEKQALYFPDFLTPLNHESMRANAIHEKLSVKKSFISPHLPNNDRIVVKQPTVPRHLEVHPPQNLSIEPKTVASATILPLINQDIPNPTRDDDSDVERTIDRDNNVCHDQTLQYFDQSSAKPAIIPTEFHLQSAQTINNRTTQNNLVSKTKPSTHNSSSMPLVIAENDQNNILYHPSTLSKPSQQISQHAIHQNYHVDISTHVDQSSTEQIVDDATIVKTVTVLKTITTTTIPNTKIGNKKNNNFIDLSPLPQTSESTITTPNVTPTITTTPTSPLITPTAITTPSHVHELPTAPHDETPLGEKISTLPTISTTVSAESPAITTATAEPGSIVKTTLQPTQISEKHLSIPKTNLLNLLFGAQTYNYQDYLIHDNNPNIENVKLSQYQRLIEDQNNAFIQNMIPSSSTQANVLKKIALFRGKKFPTNINQHKHDRFKDYNTESISDDFVGGEDDQDLQEEHIVTREESQRDSPYNSFKSKNYATQSYKPLAPHSRGPLSIPPVNPQIQTILSPDEIAPLPPLTPDFTSFVFRQEKNGSSLNGNITANPLSTSSPLNISPTTITSSHYNPKLHKSRPLSDCNYIDVTDGIDMELKNVSLLSQNHKFLLLDNVSLTIPRNSFVALVGQHRSGKSQVLNLLARELDPHDGQVFLNQHDIRNFRITDINSVIGKIEQDTLLLNLSAADNVLLANRFASNHEVIEAMRMAKVSPSLIPSYEELHHFSPQRQPGDLFLLPQTVGEKGGIYISTSNRQRIALARMILKQPKCLFIDDMTATSSLDASAVHRSLLTLAKNKTLVLVTHQLKYAKDADMIYVMSEGKMMESGNHHSLLAKSGEYARLWASQHDLALSARDEVIVY